MIPFLALAAVAVAFVLGYLLGRARRAAPIEATSAALPIASDADDAKLEVVAAPIAAAPTEPADSATHAAAVAERARLVRSFESEAAALRNAVAADRTEIARLAALAAERARLDADLTAARADAARYRQFVVDLENNAPPPLLGGPGTPDDLKLIVGIGPVLERMLYQLGITTYRQIGRWNERDIDEIDARLPEFPGRIRRDGWVTQARALHQSKYGAALPARDRS